MSNLLAPLSSAAPEVASALVSAIWEGVLLAGLAWACLKAFPGLDDFGDMSTIVKICGITNPEDAHAAVEAGADAIGLMFYEPSPRNISLKSAIEIARGLPPFIVKVGVFVL